MRQGVEKHSFELSTALTPLAHGCLLMGLAMSMANPVKAEIVAAPIELAPAGQTLVLAQNQPSRLAKFDAQLLQLSSVYPMVDISRFANSDAVAPGNYMVDVFVNQRWRQSMQVRFKYRNDSDETDLCIDKALLHLMQLDESLLKPTLWARVEKGYCGPIDALLPGVSYQFKLSQLKLTLNIPQAFLSDFPDQYVPPELWDDGDYAAYIDYNANSYWRQNHSEDSRNDQSIGIRTGLHIGRLAIRHTGYYTKPNGNSGEYQNNSLYAQTEWAALRSQVKLGDFYSYGQFFDGMKIRGAELRTDDRMLPARWRGYAPVVRGVALSNAKVTIRQQDRVIYESTVPPGEFAIRDLFPLGYGGDLQVTVTESDGREMTYMVPFSSVAQMIRPGFAYYSLSAGRVYHDDDVDNNILWQGSLQYGVTNYLTANAAAQVYPDYQAMMLGGAVNTPIGAFGLDVTQTRASIAAGQRERGERMKINYNKFFQTTGTEVYLTGYRYSEKGFSNLDGYLNFKGSDVLKTAYRQSQKKNQVQLSISQNIGQDYGSFYLSGSLNDSWHHRGRDKELQLGYGHQFKRLNYNFTFQKVDNAQSGRSEQRWMITLSMPFDVAARPQYVSVSHNRSSDADSYSQLGLSGSLDEANNWHYNLGFNRGTGISTTTMGTDYRTGQGSLSVSAGYDKDSRQASLGASGAVVLHRYGLSLSERLGDAFAVVYAKGAKGAGVRNASGVTLNRYGVAVVPYVTAYELNEIGLNPENTSFDVTLKQTAKQIVPRANTVSVVEFDTDSGRAVFFEVKNAVGAAMPMGADVLDLEGNSIGFVAQGGRVFLKGLAEQGQFMVKWGSLPEEQCIVPYHLMEAASADFYEQQNVQCQFMTVAE